MRIVLTSANFRPHVGGIERFVEILAGGLAARGHDVTVVCARVEGAPLRETVAGFEIVRIPSTQVLERRLGVPYPLPAPSLVRTLGRLVAEADVVHAHDALYVTSFAALLSARRHGVGSVLTQHVAFVPQGKPWLDTLERAAIATVGRVARLATLIATYNPAVSAWATQTWDVPPPRILPVAVQPAGNDADRTALRASFGLPPSRFLALFVGRDVPKKGLEFFASATDPSYELVAVTDRVAEMPGVHRLPFMSPERLQDLLQCVDAFVLPSEGEGFPLSLQEALGAGLPVVTTMQPGYEHYVGPDDVLVVGRHPASIRDALVRLAEDGTLRDRLAQRSLAVAERHFGIDPFVAAYEELYAEVQQLTKQRRLRSSRASSRRASARRPE